ncbi:hypothetical protein [Sphingosinicella terrae]|uniref:hypothetical protein n=1 Tax=Sphingosinicella terrae TaxID=2172047 RepID=UPI0013B3BC1F|nr:hypothetical protein [Sphingosinicella terrae]
MTPVEWLSEFRSLTEKHVETDRPLTEEDVWGRADAPLIWKSTTFAGRPSFYPVFEWNGFYSYSPLALVLKKGRYLPTAESHAFRMRPDFRYVPANVPFERELQRIGGAPERRPSLKDEDEFVEQLATALQSDVAAVEDRHPGYTNVIGCGGKDSLNLLLLPWTNPVMVVSARPNFELVQQFVHRNGLGHEVIEMEDSVDEGWDVIETALGLGTIDMQHIRWSPHRRRIAESLQRRAIFWSGALLDAYTTPRWRTLANYPGPREQRLRNLYARRFDRLPSAAEVPISHGLQRLLPEILWRRCAAFQGMHQAHVRAFSGGFPQSAYHGPAIQRVLARASLPALSRRDLRGDVGARLAGRTVWYPSTNPGPPPSRLRRDFHEPSRVDEAVTWALSSYAPSTDDSAR